MIAVSFVRKGDDIREVRRILEECVAGDRLCEPGRHGRTFRRFAAGAGGDDQPDPDSAGQGMMKP